MLPIRWGYYLSEFDPYYQYRQTKYIVENGLLGQNGWIEWHDYLSWYPWGNPISAKSYPGLPIAAASLYIFLNALGVNFVTNPTLDPLLSDPVYILCVIFPVIMGSLTCLVIYFLGKDLSGEAVGMFAALFLALDPAYIARTSLGFFDDETIGIFTLIIFILFFHRSIDKNKSMNLNLLYSVLAGLSLGYLTLSWGASRYPMVMTALFALILLLTRKYSTRLLLSYGITFFLTLSIAINIPRLGPQFLFQVEVLPVYGVLFLLCIAEINKRVEPIRKKSIYIILLVSVVLASLLFLWWRGMIGELATKFLSVLNPFIRFGSPLTESVAEHRPSAWGTFYYNWGILVFFLPVGLFFATMMATNLSIFSIIYGLTSIFFASSMIRINIILSPIVCLLGALAITHLSKPFVLFLRETSQTTRAKKRYRGIIGKETAAGILIMIFILLTLSYVIGTDFIAGPNAQGAKVYTQAYSPTTISAASLAVQPSDTARDWLNALTWIRENLPPSPQQPGEPGTVIASWWDYGYWITAIANRSSLADNGTWNSSQIKQIGLMFMSNETEAIEILETYDVTHILVFTTFDTQGRLVMAGGDEGKWQWMARIPGLDDNMFGNYTLGWDWVDTNPNGSPDQYDNFLENSKGQNSTLFKLMSFGRETVLWGESIIELEHFEKEYFSQKSGAGVTAAAPGTSIVALVCIYKVNYT